MLYTILAGLFLAICIAALIAVILRKTRSPSATGASPTAPAAGKPFDYEKFGGFLGVATVAIAIIVTVFAVPTACVALILYCSPHHNQRSCDRVSAPRQQKVQQKQRPQEKRQPSHEGLKRYSKIRIRKTADNSWTIKMAPPGTCKGIRFGEISVKRGDRVEIKARGRYIWHKQGRTVGPEGGDKTPRQVAKNLSHYPLADSRLGSLLVSIGGKNVPVGKRARFKAPADGALIVRLNDQAGQCYDQEGWLRIEVTVVKRSSTRRSKRSRHKRRITKRWKRQTTEVVIVSGKRR